MAIRRKIFRRVILYLRNGSTPHKLALSLSLGLTVGIIPLYGLTFILLSLIAFALKLNFTAAQLAHYVVHPVQLVLIFPFLKIGDWIFNSTLLPHSFSQFMNMIRTDIWGTLHNFWIAYLAATIIWLVVSIPLSIILYRVLITVFRRLVPVRMR